MARARKPKTAPRVYVRHRERPEWGTGVLVHARPVESTYAFSDGVRRVFKEAQRARFIVEAPVPEPNVVARLERGLASGGAAPKALHEDFVAQLRTNRRDGGVYLAYADWLQGEKDPRGELIVVQSQLAKKPRDPKLREAERALLEKHGAYFLPRSLRRMLEENSGCSIAWRYGFIISVRLARGSRDLVDLIDVIPELLAHPSAEFLESLVLGPIGAREHYMPAVDAIARTGHSLLEELEIDPGRSRSSRIGNIVPLFGALPGLRRLRLRGHSVRVASQTRHDELRALVIDAENKLAIAPLVKSKFAKLESLEIDMPEMELPDDVVHQLLDGTRMPALKRLVLRRTTRTRRLLDAIVKSAHLRQLEELVLTDGDMTPRSIEIATLREKWLKHLRVFQLEGQDVEDPLETRRAAATAVAANRAEIERRAWHTLARDDEIVWGERDGEAAFIRIGTTHSGCSCASKVNPCAHLQSLTLAAAQWPSFEEREVPDDFMQRLRR